MVCLQMCEQHVRHSVRFLVRAQVQVSSTALRLHNGEFPHHWKEASPEDTFLEVFDALALQDFHSANAASLFAVV